MKVSIIVPVYNVEKYIERCFNSIANQTYTNIECVFVDDCTPDKSYEMLCHLVKSYEGNIHFDIIRHSRNKGLSVARNTGTRVAVGEYIYYLDSDDEIYPNCIKNLVKIASKYKNVDIVQGNTTTIPQPHPKNDWRNISLKKYPEFSDNRKWIKKHFFAQPRIPVNAWNKLIRKSFIFDNNLFFPEGLIHEDEHWMFFVSKKINSIAFVNNYTCIHYLVEGSIMMTDDNYKSIESMFFIIKDMLYSANKFKTSEERKYLISQIKNNMLRIKTETNEKKFINLYQSLIKDEVLNSLNSLRFLDVVILLCFLFPQPIYNSSPVKRVTNLLIKKI
ncbi:MAG: glycosyltransferase family 2 protein [Bacteroidales bacterium]|nr:glycosyltransferase family 2 protein [Bacteroidales bacterium]